MGDAAREMTLCEYMNQLPSSHTARKEFSALERELAEAHDHSMREVAALEAENARLRAAYAWRLSENGRLVAALEARGHDENCDTVLQGPELQPSTKPCNCPLQALAGGEGE